MERINEAWLRGRPDLLRELFHHGIVMVLPDFGGRVEGMEAVMAGFQEFCSTCKVHTVEITDKQIAVVDRTAVASFLFDMVYERGGGKYRSSGRDVWVLQSLGDRWRAVWRTMLDVRDAPLGHNDHDASRAHLDASGQDGSEGRRALEGAR